MNFMNEIPTQQTADHLKVIRAFLGLYVSADNFMIKFWSYEIHLNNRSIYYENKLSYIISGKFIIYNRSPIYLHHIRCSIEILIQLVYDIIFLNYNGISICQFASSDIFRE